MIRDFSYIDDIINGVEILLDIPPKVNNETAPYRVSNIGNGSPESLGNFIKAIESSFGVEAKKEFLLMQPGDVTKTWADISNIEKLGYQSSTKITDCLSKFVEWYKKYNESI